MSKPTGVVATLRNSEGSQELDMDKHNLQNMPEYVIAPSGVEQPMLKTVSVTVGHTKNLGNYQSLNVQVSCTEHASDALASFNTQLDWCIARMGEAFDKIQDEKSPQSSKPKAAPQGKINPAAPQSRSDDIDL